MPTVTFEQGVSGYSGAQGNWFTNYADFIDWNFGAHTEHLFGYELGFGLCRTIQRWDLTSIPAGSTCTAATLQMYDKDYSARDRNCPINIYQIASANGDWVEGTGTGVGSQNGSSCWNKKAYNTTNWAGSAGLSTAGTDYVNTSLASYTFVDGASGLKTITFNASGLAYIQTLFGTTGGAGWLIIGDEVNSNSLTKCKSEDDATSTDRPILTITYTLATFVPRLTLMGAG